MAKNQRKEKLNKTEEDEYLDIITELADKLEMMQRFATVISTGIDYTQGTVIDAYKPDANAFSNCKEFIVIRCDDDERIVGMKGKLNNINIIDGTVDLEFELYETIPSNDKDDVIDNSLSKPSIMGGFAPISAPTQKKVTKTIMKDLRYNADMHKTIDVIPNDPNCIEKYYVLSSRGANWHFVNLFTDPDLRENLKPGTKVFINEKGLISYIDLGVPNYSISTVRVTVQNIHSDNLIEIEGNRLVRLSPEIKWQIVGQQRDLEVGDDIIVDVSGTIALARIDKNAHRNKKVVQTSARVEWDSVVGLEEAKQRIVDNVINPMKHKDLYKTYGMSNIPKGMMLYGPPGCGKTMLGRAIATAIADASGYDMTDTGFIYIKSTELLNSYVGESERSVRNLFLRARRHTEKSGWPAIIFIDEADAILANRDGNHLNKSLVAPFLTEMDGFDNSSAFVILATNRHDMLDPAITRNGRIDFKVRVNRPTKDILQGIIYKGLSKTLCFDDVNALSQAAADEFWDEAKFIKSIKTHKYGDINIRLSDCANGAMAQSIVNEAITSSIKRDIDNGGTITGVTREDVIGSVRSIYHQSQNLSHDDVLYEMVERIENN